MCKEQRPEKEDIGPLTAEFIERQSAAFKRVVKERDELLELIEKMRAEHRAKLDKFNVGP